jgi:hypothetical protein
MIRIRMRRAVTIRQDFNAGDVAELEHGLARELLAAGDASVALDDVPSIETAREAALETATEDRR